jgi:hypothetical protein
VAVSAQRPGAESQLTKTFSKKDYAALGRTLLHGEPPPEQLKEPLTTLAIELHSLLLDTSNPRAALLVWLLPFSLWYMALEGIHAKRLPARTPQIKAIANSMKVATQILLPKIGRALAVGDARSLSQLAVVVDTARTLASVKDVSKGRRAIARLFRVLGVKGGKRHKNTERLRALFPLWSLGMGQLSYEEKCEVFQGVGFADAEIPEDDALRQMLSYYSIPKVVKALERKRKLAEKEAPSNGE